MALYTKTLRFEVEILSKSYHGPERLELLECRRVSDRKRFRCVQRHQLVADGGRREVDKAVDRAPIDS